MRLTPIDLIHKRFPTTVKGYARAAVEDFLREVAADYEVTVAENAGLVDRVETLEREIGRYRSIEKTLQEALVLAQTTAEELRATAHREADALLREARGRAEAETGNARQQLEDLRQQRLRFAREFRALLLSHLDGLESAVSSPVVHEPEGIAAADSRQSALVGSARNDAGSSGLAAGG